MKELLLSYSLPFVLAVVIFFSLTRYWDNDKHLFPVSAGSTRAHLSYVENFNNDPLLEDQFLQPGSIYLLGSSELATASAAMPYNFISSKFSTKVKGIGHAGNQCLSIYTQLLAKDELLSNSKITIILSPGWFESKPSKGTSSKIFLEFNSPAFLNNILNNAAPPEYKAYLYKRIAELYPEFSNSGAELKVMNFKHRASNSFLHSFLYCPLIKIDEQFLSPPPKHDRSGAPGPKPEQVRINWDSLFETSRTAVMKGATNNSMGINNEYYSQYINGKSGHVKPVSSACNRELQDFYMLADYLADKKANVNFIISPLNPYYYKNLAELNTTVNAIKKKLESKKFPYLNLFIADTNKYNKALLHDVMHMSDYAWYKVDSFMIHTFHLSNE